MLQTFILRKILRALLTALLAVTFVFVLLRLAGSPAVSIYGENTPIEVIEHFNKQFGLDRSLIEQYITFLGQVIRGEFGVSFRNGNRSVDIIAKVLPATLWLGFSSLALALVIGLPAGLIAALNPGTIWDRLIMGFAISGYALPNFFFGILLILTFTMKLRLLPSAGADTWAHLVMPTLTLGTAYAGILSRFVRAAMYDVLNKPYIAAARSRGFSYMRTALLHAIPNAALPTVTVFGLLVGGVLSGAVVTETVFSWPGAGQLLVQSVAARDFPVIQTLIIYVTLAMVLVNLAVDLAYGFLDPRIRSGSSLTGGKHG